MKVHDHGFFHNDLSLLLVELKAPKVSVTRSNLNKWREAHLVKDHGDFSRIIHDFHELPVIFQFRYIKQESLVRISEHFLSHYMQQLYKLEYFLLS